MTYITATRTSFDIAQTLICKMIQKERTVYLEAVQRIPTDRLVVELTPEECAAFHRLQKLNTALYNARRATSAEALANSVMPLNQ